MDKNDHPTSFGVFKPVGHTVIAFTSQADRDAAAAALLAQGFTPEDLVRYSPQEMLAQADADLLSASPMASVAQELNLVKAHRALAQEGCSFLVAHASHDAGAAQVDTVVRSMHAVSAQRYGRFLIEELVDRTPGNTQVFESPDRGLDLETPAGKTP